MPLSLYPDWLVSAYPNVYLIALEPSQMLVELSLLPENGLLIYRSFSLSGEIPYSLLKE